MAQRWWMQAIATVARIIRLDRRRNSNKVSTEGVVAMRPRLSILLMLLVLAFAPNVLADSYTFTTSGCFSGGTCSSNGSSSVNFKDLLGADATLSFTNVSSPTTTSGTSFSLGSFNLTSLPGISVYNGSFTLNVDFSSPNAAGNPLVASVLGGVLVNAGGAIITFSPGSEVF